MEARARDEPLSPERNLRLAQREAGAGNEVGREPRVQHSGSGTREFGHNTVEHSIVGLPGHAGPDPTDREIPLSVALFGQVVRVPALDIEPEVHRERVLGKSGSRKQRGEADKASEIGRFPRLFRAVESVPAGLTWPTITFTGRMTVWLGKLEVQLLQLGRGHTKGDTVVWLPQEKVLFSGDLVEYDATPYAGDAYFQDWPKTLDNLAALRAERLVPGRGAALSGAAQVKAGLEGTRSFVSELYASVKSGAAAGRDLRAVYRETFERLSPKYGQWVIFNHCMPFDVTRAYDEATQFPDPRIWTAERDQQMWAALEG